ncbi:hypothetical protein ABZ865_05105 [Streptomyces sp. NPDC047085]|jgi:hypothetical protein
MKLGKALATGIAEEQPSVHRDEAERPEENTLAAPAEPAREEVPAAR